MTTNAYLQLGFYIVVLIALAKPLGAYMARVYEGQPALLNRLGAPVAHPFENPTALSNFLELLSILLISAALCYTFGVMVKDTRQGWAVLATMTIVFVGLLAVAAWSESNGNPVLARLGVDQTASATQPGGNMEGKEARFGIANSALWATATTAASNGSVNSMYESYTPLGGLVPLWDESSSAK